VTVIVAAPPQLKVTVPSKLPPPGRQASNAASVQLALVPVPTTHAKTDEIAADTARASRASTSTSGVQTVVVFIAGLRLVIAVATTKTMDGFRKSVGIERSSLLHRVFGVVRGGSRGTLRSAIPRGPTLRAAAAGRGPPSSRRSDRAGTPSPVLLATTV